MRYLTLAEPYDWAAEPVKGSRFQALLRPVTDEVAAIALVRGIERDHPAVDHCCWAWRLRNGGTRTWDAGEPRGSAGRPILQQLEGHAVFDVLAVVLRDFGGTKLGVGGLMRAYGGTAGMALDRAGLVEVAETVEVEIAHPYGDTGPVDAVLAASAAVQVSVEWGEGVCRVVRVEQGQVEALVTAMRDRTAGRVVPTLRSR